MGKESVCEEWESVLQGVLKYTFILNLLMMTRPKSICLFWREGRALVLLLRSLKD